MNCTYLRQSDTKCFCMKKSAGIDIKICDTCSSRKHSGVEEFVTTAVEIIKQVPNGPVMATKELKEERWKRCKECEFYNNRRCKICGCFLDVKIQFQSTHCPRRKW